MSTWNIDTAHSAINFSVRHMVFAKVRGRFDRWHGSLNLDPAQLAAGSVQVEIEAGSIDTGVADRDNHLRSADFFDAEKFPKLSFKSTGVAAGSGDRLKITGQLTIRDVTREVVLDAEFGGQAKDPWGNQRVAFTAKTAIDRKEYGLTWNQLLETGGALVGEKIEIEIEVEGVQAA